MAPKGVKESQKTPQGRQNESQGFPKTPVGHPHVPQMTPNGFETMTIAFELVTATIGPHIPPGQRHQVNLPEYATLWVASFLSMDGKGN